MSLKQSDITLFFKLWYSLLWDVNEKYKVIPHFKKPAYPNRLTVDFEEFIKVRNALWDNPQWIDEFLAKHNNGEFTEQEREIIINWRKHFIKGTFVIIKHLPKYAIVMAIENKPPLLYAACGISHPIENLCRHSTPFQTELALIPFKGKIIYDGLLSNFATFNEEGRSLIKEQYCQIKKKYGIIEVLNDTNPTRQLTAKKTKKKKAKSADVALNKAVAVLKDVKVPKAMSARYIEIANIIETFCNEKLNVEYKEICLRALAKLCRKRPSPLTSGKAHAWACGIVYAIGSNNFLFDKTQSIHVSATEIREWFGLPKSTAGDKAAKVTKHLDLSYFNTEFSLKHIRDSNPMIWYISVNGYIVDVRNMPYTVQQEAFRKGLIPYIPSDKWK